MAENTGNYLNLTVLTGILQDPLIAAFAAYRNGKAPALKAKFLHELFEKKAEENFAAYVADVVIHDENAFSRACAAGSDISPYLQNAYIADLLEIGRAIDFESPEFNMGKAPVTIKSWDDKAANLLYGYYQSAGYGRFISHFEFRYDCEQGLIPVPPCPFTLADLKGYEREKAETFDNLENFVKGLPCADMLLYGERGTGRSATIRATAVSLASQKLRLVELDYGNLSSLPRLVDLLSGIPLRFLVLIESLEAGARLPTCSAENVLLAATSAVPVEGFGLQIMFRSIDRTEFLEIARELVKEYKVKLPAEGLEPLADAWIERHGLSPRSARRLVGQLVATQRKGKDLLKTMEI